MADRVVENAGTGVPELPEILEKVLLFSLNEARAKVAEGQDVVPFTALVVGDDLFLESHPGESPEECFSFARHTVQGARGASAYALCYDGYIDTDEGTKDALIAEGGVPGANTGYAIGLLYEPADDAPAFEDEPVYIGEAPNFMIALHDASEYKESDIDEKYRD